MINMVRIDERLIHGQVAMIWSKQLGVDRIIVVNEKAATDPILSSTLKMAAPDSVKVIILNEEKAKVLLKDPRINDLNILVIVNSPKDALFVVENADIKKVNIGNYGKASKNGEERSKLNDNVFLGEQDKDYLREIIKLGVITEYQLVPDQPITDMKTVL
ncbi:PTS sugar transporter subunit IIB [Enterococcus avium]|uniref:PTS system mannose/fructose/N-acetylgalactosamine-transporter subunit IIB n=1 Tax=Enterococcus avium TaxID=33945 RepID=UPI001A975B17|nr:PTS sugar transporter subunit IIB [Enterococcus avium]MBO1138464.1 PTS sugar transporter subunit IIB [Enterococcus avium]MDT2479401.1 PTS sugar transporter subunit IIB [Enterococcus avium]